MTRPEPRTAGSSEAELTSLPATLTVQIPIPHIEGDQADFYGFQRAATLLYTLMATGMREAEACRRLRNEYGPRYEG